VPPPTFQGRRPAHGCFQPCRYLSELRPGDARDRPAIVPSAVASVKVSGLTLVLTDVGPRIGCAGPAYSFKFPGEIDRLADPAFIPCPPAGMNVCRFAGQKRALSQEMQRCPVMNMIGRKQIYLFDRRLPKRSSAWIRLSDAQRSRLRRVRGSAALDNQGWRQDDRDWSDQDH
jgi:hypothetical protein